MINQLTPEQIQDLPWASLDDLLDARTDVEEHGRCWAEIVDDDGDLRLKRIPPDRVGFRRRRGRSTNA